VWVEVDTRRDSVIVEVGDDGPGMSADFIHERLFAPFHSNKHGGFGVGVYQCREFARERGGDLDVISSPGSGTTMRLRLPVVARAEEPGEVETTI
jgi:signal transduction histidine kinase